jgi:hypothetical protein
MKKVNFTERGGVICADCYALSAFYVVRSLQVHKNV